jgi:hypothetical protein
VPVSRGSELGSAVGVDDDTVRVAQRDSVTQCTDGK